MRRSLGECGRGVTPLPIDHNDYWAGSDEC
jgi:hypothetical protein